MRALFNGLGSMHILGFPFGFCTDTMPLVQSLLQSTGVIISLSTRLCNSSRMGFHHSHRDSSLWEFHRFDSGVNLYFVFSFQASISCEHILNSVFISFKVHENYIYHNQQQLINYTNKALRSLGEPIQETSNVAWQNR